MATWTIADGGGDWNNNATWVEGGGFPVAGDAVVATGTSGALTVNVASACATIILTNYTNTLTFNAALTVTSTVTFVAGMTIAGTSDLICNGTATLTAGGKTLTGGLQLKGTATYTFADAWVCNGTLTIASSSSVTMTGSTISCGGLAVNSGMPGGGGATTVITLASGTWTHSSASNQCKQPLTLAAGVTVSGTVYFADKTLTATAGAITTTSSLLKLSGCTVNASAATWNDVYIAGTVTVNSLLTAGGSLQWNAAANAGLAGTAGVTCYEMKLAVAPGAARTYTLQYGAGRTYTVTNFLNMHFDSGAPVTLASSSATAGQRAILNLQAGATQDCTYLNATRIDSSGGDTVHSLNGILTDSVNWDTPGTGYMWLA